MKPSGMADDLKGRSIWCDRIMGLDRRRVNQEKYPTSPSQMPGLLVVPFYPTSALPVAFALRDNNQPGRSQPPAWRLEHETACVDTPLSDWNRAMDLALARAEPDAAAQMAQIVLRHLPRHLATYQRLLQVTWALKRWDEGEDWARRLLQADPGNALAWRLLARAAEGRTRRAQAHAMWRRAFEMGPYDPEIRAGLARTSLDDPNALALDLACLAVIYLRGLRWEAAARTYRQLVKADPRRIDFQLYLMAALWQSRALEEAYTLARHLVKSHPHLLLAWVVLDATGDENDQALARNPIETMDPDGDYVGAVLGAAGQRATQPRTAAPALLAVGDDEAARLAAYLGAA
jgi:tetratricopeptide (TPR) repeat protein